MSARRSGSELLCDALEACGVEHVFGLPGTQTVGLYDALRRCSIRSVLCTHELGAGFMANGYARASGRVGVVVAIPGPGFTYALTGLAEARVDSAPLLLITLMPARSPGRAFQHQAIAQSAIAGPLVKGVVEAERVEEILAAVARAHALALEGEPGPVLLQVSGEALAGSTDAAAPVVASLLRVDRTALDQLVAEVAGARRPVFLAGQGAAGAAAELVVLAERLGVPVVTTPSGRGVIPEDHLLAMGFDSSRGDVAVLNELFAAADLVLALGAKLSHNGTVGFAFRLRPECLVHVDTGASVLNANYPAKLAVQARAEDAVAALVEGLDRRSEWTSPEIAQWRTRLSAPTAPHFPEPTVHGVAGGTPQGFFEALRGVLPRDAILVTDSGLHQTLVRRHFPVWSARGLIAPNDFQSMGFGLPAAIGAALAAPSRKVVAVIGDGGLVMAGMEILTAVRLSIPLTVVVFNDGRLNLIRMQQLKEFGRGHDTDLLTPDLAAFAEASGVRHLRVGGNVAAQLEEAIASKVPTLVEVLVGDSSGIHLLQTKSVVRESVRGLLGPRLVRWLKGKLR